MAQELRQWAPSRWSPFRLEAFTRHVHMYTEEFLCDFLGWYEGNMLAAELRNARLAAESKAALAAAGVATMDAN